MKKLMIAALVAAMGGVAMAENCGEPLTCPFVYRVKLAGKTVAALSTASNKVTCVDGNCWVKPTSLRIAGYLYGEGSEKQGQGACGETTTCDCIDLATAQNVFWGADKVEVKLGTFDFSLFEILRNGGAKNKAQIVATAGGLTFAGFGAYNPVTGNLKNANGFFAGTLDPAKCTTITNVPCEDPTVDAKEAYVYAPCTLTEDQSKGSVAFGRWNLAYKADKVALAQKLAIKYGKDTVWATPGLVTPKAFVAVQ